LDRAIKIRLGSEKDIEEILKIENSLFEEDSWSRNMIFSELKKGNNKKTFLVEKNEQLIAYIMIRFSDYEYQILNLAVSKPEQKKGIGFCLLIFFLKKIPVNSSVFLEVKESNFPAISLYNKVGFIKQYVRKRYYTDGSNALVLHHNKVN
jgi:ribosomal-protein-alanine acetyltransferase